MYHPPTHSLTHSLTIALHLLQYLDSTLLLSGVVVEHPLDEVSGHKHLFGENVQQLVVDGQVQVDAKLWHLLQGCVDELHMAAPPHVFLHKHVNHFVEGGLGSGLGGHQLKQVILSGHRRVLLVLLIGEACRQRLVLAGN